jgi:deoxyribonuclease V
VQVAWPSDAAELEALQCRLAAMTPPRYRPTAAPRVGACFVCFAEDADALATGAEPAFAAAATFEGGRRVAAHVVAGTTAAGYAPGLLALRAGPLLERAVAGLPVRPDVLLVDATGRDHPRRAGLALHLGAVLDLPTVGVTDRPLVAVADVGSPELAGAEPVPLAVAGEVVAHRVVTRAGVRPLVVHAAWRTDPATALAWVRGIAGATRTPAPLREARRLARTARAVAAGRAPRPASDPAAT